MREVAAGHDGTWVAHPALIPLAREVFDAHMPARNQQRVLRDDVRVDRDDLLRRARSARISRAGFDNNVEVCVRYLAAWLDGQGCVPIHWLMEDAATAEIARAQLWQWLHARRRCTSTTARRSTSPCSTARCSACRHGSATACACRARAASTTAIALLDELTHATRSPTSSPCRPTR